ncbi:MAG: DinB family protein, partial [Chitinophagaceae bacterium]
MTEKEAIIAEIRKEGAGTRKMLERLTDTQLSFKPHEKSYSAAALATHVSNLPFWILMILDTDGLDLGSPLPRLEPFTNVTALIAFFDERLSGAVSALEAAEDTLLEKNWHLSKGENTIMKAPKKMVIRYFALNHLVHHRGQLSVYLRLQDVPVPGMYGPSAD